MTENMQTDNIQNRQSGFVRRRRNNTGKSRSCSRLINLLLSMTAGAATGLGYIYQPLCFVCFFSAIPLFYNILFRNKGKAFSSVFMFSFSFSLVSDIWLINIGKESTDDPALSVLISIVVTVGVPAVIALFHSIPFIIYKHIQRNNLLDIGILSFLYILGEWLAGSLYPVAFPWNRLCCVVSGFTPFIQSASLFGGLFISLIIMLINGFLAAAFYMTLIKRNFGKTILPAISAVSIFLVNTVGGLAVMETHPEYDNNYRVLILQGNYPKKEKIGSSHKDIAEKYLSIAERESSESFDLVVLPETTFTSGFFDDEELIRTLSDFCRKNNSVVVTGAQLNENDIRYNITAAVTADGVHPDVYRKQLLVPFGEYSPVGSINFISSSFSAGDECGMINTDIGKIGCIICFESIFSGITADCVKNGAEVLTVLSNDSWLGRSIPLYQHHSHSVLRAVENRRFVLTSTNTGISSVVSPYGEISVKTDANTEAEILANFAMIRKNSFYTLAGDIVIIPSCILVLSGILKMIYNLYCIKRKKRL